MFGDGARFHPKEDQRAGTGIGRSDLGHHVARAFGQHLARARLAPVAAVGRDRERLGADNLAPDAPGEPEAIAADALEARLVVIGRAEPGSGGGDDLAGRSRFHNTAPSWPPSFVA